MNLYGFVGNDGVNQIDLYGMISLCSGEWVEDPTLTNISFSAENSYGYLIYGTRRHPLFFPGRSDWKDARNWMMLPSAMVGIETDIAVSGKLKGKLCCTCISGSGSSISNQDLDLDVSLDVPFGFEFEVGYYPKSVSSIARLSLVSAKLSYKTTVIYNQLKAAMSTLKSSAGASALCNSSFLDYIEGKIDMQKESALTGLKLKKKINIEFHKTYDDI